MKRVAVTNLIWRSVLRGFPKINRAFEHLLLPVFPVIACVQFFLLIFLSLFGITWIVASEFLLYIHAVVAMLTLVTTMAIDGHIRIDIFSSRLKSRGKAWLELWGSLLCLCTTGAVIFFLSMRYAYFSWLFWETSSSPSGLRGIFLFKSVLPLVGGLLFWEGCIGVWCSLRFLLQR